MNDIFLNCLEELEKRESLLLSWGITNFSFSEDEIDSIVENILNEKSITDDPYDCVQEMCKKGLLFEFENENLESNYRTRMAETVRLLSNLRQIFNDNWEESPELVGDYRFIRRPRMYPKRNISVDQIIQKLTNLTSLSKDIISSIIGNFELAQFQFDAIKRIRDAVKIEESSGTIVCAGTGSGKTLAFYLPAISSIAENVYIDKSTWTRVIAIYPRNELLKDQMSETVSILQKVNLLLQERRIRQIKVGAFFGPTPNSNIFDLDDKVWKYDGDGNICPFVICPKCQDKMKWKTEDRKQKQEILTCINDKSHKVDCVKLTRESIKNSQPDILFTSTEMLNQRMADSKVNKIFGIGRKEKNKPFMFLLDEVHTYYGTHGAQVASLIKRWRHLSHAKPHFVGLSATLQDAQNFFSTLTGLSYGSVSEISHLQFDMEEEGAEYMVVLRGNSINKKNLMSTTIQTALLMNRMSDHPDRHYSSGVFGTKQFIFGDDLDAINRLYYNILSAEGRNSFDGSMDPRETVLASWRIPDNFQKFEAGQSWDFSEQIGHNLGESPRVGRVSSQDAGTDCDAMTIVASSSLEVGFNDPSVGTVIQHKAPRDNASFLQRKGRAGRKRKMRPWMVVVLSDYGRDRLAYQNYDHLFDPEVSARNLPVNNLYVLRMQSVYATMDWLYSKLGESNIWKDLSGTKDGNAPRGDYRGKFKKIIDILKLVLKCEYDFNQLYNYIKFALKLFGENDKYVLHKIFWEHPRGLMISVLPSLLRKLETNWTRDGKEWSDRYDFWHPLPDFVANTLFGELNLAEVYVTIPAQARIYDEEIKPMPIQQAIKEFAPGRISKRFATRNAYAAVWIDPYLSEDHTINISDYCGSAYEIYPEDFLYIENSEELSIKCVKPYKIFTARPGPEYADTSNSFLVWKSQIIAPKNGVFCKLPKESNWYDIIEGLIFFIHNNNSSVEVRRFALGAEASISFKNRSRESELLECHFVKTSDNAFGVVDENGSEPVAIGYSQNVDGFSIRFKLPKNILDGESDKKRSLRINYFSYLFNERNGTNVFLNDRIVRIYLTSIIFQSYINNISISDSIEAIQNMDLSCRQNIIEQVINVTIGISQSDNTTDLIQELRTIFLDASLWSSLFELSSALYSEKEQFNVNDWLIKVFKSTLGAAVHLAMQKICPDLDFDEVLVDTEISKKEIESGIYQVWFTEQGPGGLGVIERVFDEYNRDPRRVLDMIEDCLDESKTEQVDSQLYKLLEYVNSSNEISSTLNSIRNASGLQERLKQFNLFRKQLIMQGIDAEDHYLMSTVSNRLLKNGTNSTTDKCLYEIVRDWKNLENRIGLDIDIESFVYCIVTGNNIDTPFQVASDTPQAMFNSVYSMLWPRGGKVRSGALSVYNPFFTMPATERLLVRDALKRSIKVIDLEETEKIYDDIEKILETDGIVKVKSKNKNSDELTRVIRRLTICGLDIFSLILYPRVMGVEKAGDYLYTTIDIREKIQ